MKLISKIFVVFICILLILFVAKSIKNHGNFFSAANQIEEAQAHITSYEADEEHVRPIGRTVFKDGVRWLSFSGAGIEFDCDAVYFNVMFLSDTTSQSFNHKPKVAIIVNGDTVFDELLSEDRQNVRISLSDYDGPVKVRIIKQSESMFSAIGIEQIRFYERRETRPTVDYSMKIEFIGDSITAGYGIDETNNNASFSTKTQNFAKTYAYLTAEALEAQYSAIAFSGYGVLSGSTTNGQLNSKATVLNYYDKAITNKKFDSPNDELWDSNNFEPDFVVINLGTNDATYCTTRERRNAFTDEYEKQLELVHEKNPNAYILCILADVNNSLFENIEEAVENFKNQTSYEKVSASIINFDMAGNGTVIQGHPSEKAHSFASDNLVNVIKEITENKTENSNEEKNEPDTSATDSNSEETTENVLETTSSLQDESTSKPETTL